MAKQKETVYSLKPKLQDFIPWVGSFIYQARMWRKAEVKNQTKKPFAGRDIGPEPDDKYHAIIIGLTALNTVTGMVSMYAIFKGLEALIK